MQVGICRLSLHLHASQSLKDKRQVASSIVSRVNSRFKVSIAEVDDNELWQRLTLGISCVSNNGRHANEVLSKVVEYVQEISGDAELLDYELELLTAL